MSSFCLQWTHGRADSYHWKRKKFWSYKEEHFFLWFLSRLSQIIIISKQGCTECNIMKYECHDCVFRLDCIMTAFFKFSVAMGYRKIMSWESLCRPKILILKINVVVVSYYVCRTFPPLQVCCTACNLGIGGKTLRSNGKSRPCSTCSVSLERLSSGPLWFYLYAWPGIFPERWLNTRWQRPLQPPLLRSRHGQCRAAPQRWDLRRGRDKQRKQMKAPLGEVRERGKRNSKRQTIHNRARRKKRLFLL